MGEQRSVDCRFVPKTFVYFLIRVDRRNEVSAVVPGELVGRPLAAAIRTNEAVTMTTISLKFIVFPPFSVRPVTGSKYFNAPKEQILITLLRKQEMLFWLIATESIYR